MKQDIYNLLLRSFDFELSSEETAILEKALEQSPALRKEKAQLMASQNMLTSWNVNEDPDFSNGVMDRIGQLKQQVQDNFSHSIIQLFPKMAAACVVFIMILLVNIYLADGSLSSEAMLGLENLYPEEAEFTELGL